MALWILRFGYSVVPSFQFANAMSQRSGSAAWLTRSSLRNAVNGRRVATDSMHTRLKTYAFMLALSLFQRSNGEADRMSRLRVSARRYERVACHRLDPRFPRVLRGASSA